MTVTVLLLCFLTQGVGQAAGSGTEQAATTGEIQGSVVEIGSSQPVHKALVTLRKAEDSALGTYTDPGGKFTFRDIEPGTYLISAEHDGFVADAKAERPSVTVAAGVVKNAGTLKLTRTGAVSGRIVGADGEPITGASVQLQPWNAKKDHPAPMGYATTDDRGNYRAYSIAPGKYRLAVTYLQRHAGPPLKMQLGKGKSKDVTPETYGTTYYPGSLDPRQAVAIQIDAGADLQGVSVQLLHTSGVRVAGRVTGPDGGPAGPFVMVILQSPEHGLSYDSQLRQDGSFELLQVAPGKYTLSAMGMLEQGKQTTANKQMEIGDADIVGVQLALSPQQSVSGKVVVPPDRKLPQGLMLILHSREQLNNQSVGQSGGFAQVHENGSFIIEGVNPGDYDVVLANTGKGDDLYVEGIRSGDQDILAEGLHIDVTAPAPLEVELKSNGAQIDFTVLDAKSQPVPEAQVTLLPEGARNSVIALRGECRTDASGKCAVLGITPGSYRAFAFLKEDQVDFLNPDVMATIEKQGEPVTVAEGDRKTMQLKVLQLEQQ